MSDLKYSDNPLVISDYNHGHLGIDSDSSELQIGSALVVKFARVCERVIEALYNVDI
jgi:hypothetical protein